MLLISEQSFAAMQATAKDRFRTRAIAHVRAHPTFADPATDAPGFTDYGVARGQARGFRAEAELLKFIDLMLLAGHDFEQRPQHSRANAALDGDGEPWERLNRARMLLEGVDPEQRAAWLEHRPGGSARG